jgi:hypothetical protein
MHVHTTQGYFVLETSQSQFLNQNISVALKRILSTSKRKKGKQNQHSST